jgi:N-acetylglutamate synthase-like GNAT family acetyltransferase
MTDSRLNFTKAGSADLTDLLSLLTLVKLPHEGVAEHLPGFFVARDEEQRLIACVGLERYGKLGLLRSVAVLPEHQHTGIGSRLTAALLQDAAESGVEEVVLLTRTAKDFFARRFGFVEADRTDYNERLAGSPEWALPRCSSAILMRLHLE